MGTAVKAIETSEQASAGGDVFVFPASFGQQRLWLLDQLIPGSSLYNVPASARLNGALDVSALEAALSEILRRHEVLRATFRMQDGQVVQVIPPAEKVSLPVLDLQHLPEQQREQQAVELAEQDVRRAFDLARGPLIRA